MGACDGADSKVVANVEVRKIPKRAVGSVGEMLSEHGLSDGRRCGDHDRLASLELSA